MIKKAVYFSFSTHRAGREILTVGPGEAIILFCSFSDGEPVAKLW